MLRASALGFAVVLSASGCGNEIVLGDSTLALPANPGAAGRVGGGVGGMSGAGGSTSGSDASGGANAGTPPNMPDTPIPAVGELVWSTDYEVGDWSDWERGGMFYGGEYEWGDVNAYVDIGVGRDRSNGAVIDINTNARGETSSGGRLYRRIEAGPAYYRAWFRLEDAHSVSDWWSIFLFHSRDDSLSLDNDVSLWDVRVVDAPGGSGGMALQFFDHDVMQGTLAGRQGNIVENGWFELEAYLDYRPPNATRLALWLNGTQLFDMKGLHTAAQANVFWSIGNGAAKLDPADSTLDLDDAAIHKAGAP
jgi:hypothetical protein